MSNRKREGGRLEKRTAGAGIEGKHAISSHATRAREYLHRRAALTGTQCMSHFNRNVRVFDGCTRTEVAGDLLYI